MIVLTKELKQLFINGLLSFNESIRVKENDIAFAVKGADRLHNLRCALVATDKFKRKYIWESIDWYLDFMPEIPAAVRNLMDLLEKGKEEFPLV